jgi:Xaa-Pro aminopeptidase
MVERRKDMQLTPRHLGIQEELNVNQIDVACILKPHNVLYFAGYAPVCSGALMFPDLEPVFCTLWLDAPEAMQFCTIPNMTSYVFPRESLMGKLVESIKKNKPSPKRIGVEKDFMLLRDYERLLKEFPDAEFVHIGSSVDKLRAIKSEEEIRKIRTAAEISDRAMEAALEAVRPGVTELDIAAEAEYAMKKLGSEKPAFSTFVASGKRTRLAHPLASRREIQPGDAVVIDLGATWDGYASDLCRTAFAGDPTPEQAEHLRLIVKAQEAAASIMRDGARCSEIFDAAYDVLQKEDLGKFLPDDIGYGVGLRQSEFYPVIEKGSGTLLKENMVVALLQTAPFSKRIGGLRVEDTFQVTQIGCEKLTRHVQILYS